MSAPLDDRMPLGPIRCTMSFIVLAVGGDVVITGQKTRREKLGIDVMAQHKASALKAQGRQDGAGMEFIALAVGEPNAGAVLRAAMPTTAFGAGGDAPGDENDEVTLTLLSQRPTMFQDSEVETQDRVGALKMTVDDPVDHGFPPKYAKTLRYIVFRTNLDVFRRELLGDPPERVETMTLRLQPGARAVWVKPRASPLAKTAWLHEHITN